jgi:hypothetical protein
VNILLFFADADRIDSSGATSGPVKSGIKNKKRTEGKQTKKLSTKED